MKKLLVLFVGLMLLILAMVAAGCGSSSSASQMVNNAIKQIQSLKSAHVDLTGTSTAVGSTSGASPHNLSFNISTDTEQLNQASPKFHGNIQVKGLDQSQGNIVAAILNQGTEFTVVDGEVYVNTGGNWYDVGTASDLLGNVLRPLTTLAQGMGGLGGSSTSTQGATNAETTGATGTSTAAHQQCFVNAFKDNSKFGADQLFSNLTNAGSENIDGTSTTHITGDLDLDKTLSAVADISRGCGNAEVAAGIEGAQAQIKSLFKKFSVEMWIDGSNNFRQIKVTIDLNGAALGVLGGLGTGTSTTGASTTTTPLSGLSSLTVDATVKFSKLNQSFNITKPAGTIHKISDLTSAAGLGGMGNTGGASGTSTNGGTTSTGSTPTTSGY